MEQYLECCRYIMEKGTRKANRTGVDTLSVTGLCMKFSLRDGFPLLTTKKMAYKSCFAEMLGFIRGYDNAGQFRSVGTKVWDANANENQTWLNNPYRLGTDDLGRIYGTQWRRWRSRSSGVSIDQFKLVYTKLREGVDDRRLIVTAWNPGELDRMALPPCHLLFQFSLQFDTLNLCMYQRSADFALGVPFNIAGYAWLLQVMARITGYYPGSFTHFLCDCHLYENQLEGMWEQLQRSPKPLPILHISERVRTLEDLEEIATVDDFIITNYEPHPKIEYPFAV